MTTLPIATRSRPSDTAHDRNRLIAFTMALGGALNRFGAPSHRLEEALTVLTNRIGMKAQFFSTPTALFASYDDGRETETRLLRTTAGDLDLSRLSELDELMGDVGSGRISVDEGRERLDASEARGAPYGGLLTAGCFALASATAGRFFGGGLNELAATALIGLLIGGLAWGAGRFAMLGRVFEPLAAFVAAVTAVSLAALIPPTNVHVAMLGGLIILIPGLTLTRAMSEIATGHLVSGTARLTGALVSFVTIAFGVALGTHVAEGMLGEVLRVESLPLPDWTLWFALALAPLSFTILFRARLRDTGWIVLAGWLAFFGSRLGAELMGPELGTFVGAFGVGAASNLFANMMRRPASVMLLPGILLLVPGSLGFGSLTSLLQDDVVGGLDAAFTMTLVAVSLVTGLLFANVIVPTRRVL